ncbi:hypothetical protein AB0K59_38340, partial [Streptomyces scopuliridis]
RAHSFKKGTRFRSPSGVEFISKFDVTVPRAKTRGAGTTSLRDVQGGRSLRSRWPRDARAAPSAALQEQWGPAAARPTGRASRGRATGV